MQKVELASSLERRTDHPSAEHPSGVRKPSRLRGRLLSLAAMAGVRRRENGVSGVYGVVYNGQGRAAKSVTPFRKAVLDTGAQVTGMQPC